MNAKNIIAPLQMWLLSQGRCVGCGRDLGKEKNEATDGIIRVTCRCRRIFIYDPREKIYRRALFEEI